MFQLTAPLDPVWQDILWGIPVGLIALLIYRLASYQSDITAMFISSLVSGFALRRPLGVVF